MFYCEAKWIYCNAAKKEFGEKYGAPSPYFRMTFSVDKPIRRATLHCTALGVFKAYINGKETDNDYLSPGWTDYYKRIPYMTYDITKSIRENNAIGIIAGDGWAVGYLGFEVKRENYSDRIEIIASIVIEYLDGTIEYIETDKKWKTNTGEIRRSDIFMGEYVDARLALKNFSEYDYDDSAWINASEVSGSHCRKIYLLEEAIAPKTTVKHCKAPQFLHKDAQNRLVYDFFQNMVGVVKVTLKGSRGTKLIFHYGEMLNSDGMVYVENLREAESIDTYILAGEGIEVFRPLFTFHGFRYMDIEINGEAEIVDISGEVMYSDLKETGDFSCDNETNNKLYKNIVWGQRGNFLNLPTDCPQRDERLGWTGDSQIFCQTAMFNMDCRSFYKKHLADIRDSQLGNGGIPGIAPVVPHKDYSILFGRVGCAGWADVITVLPYEYYRMYGDISVVKENLTAAKRHIDYYLKRSKNYILPAGDNYGDWLAIGEETDKSLIATAFFAYSADLTAKLCELACDNDAFMYRKLFNNIKERFRFEFLCSKTGKLKGDTQTAYLLAYSFGLMTKAEIKAHLLNAIERFGCRLSTGFLGVKYLLPVLCEIGETELAYGLFTSKDYPSWCYSVVNGATTIWERWNSFTLENGFGDKLMNSFNHYAYGSVGEWMFKYCLGIIPNETKEGAGFKKLTLRPFFDTSGAINFAKGYYDSINGKIEVEWKRQDDGFVYSVKLPECIDASFDFGSMTAIQLSKNKFLLRK